MSICDKNITKEECSKDKDNQCDYNNFKRARYFHGMLMTDRDFREEQIYHNEKRKLLNRTLHGWGVVCGLKIKPDDKESGSIIIERGLAFDCAGNEILVCEPYKLNVLEAIKLGPSPKDPCAQIKDKLKWYIIIRYKEVCTDPNPVYAPGGGCEEKVCEYSRIREGYCFDLFQIVNGCPEQLRKPKDPNDPCSAYNEESIRKFLCEDLLLSCSGNCCDNPYVVLGSITFVERITNGTTINSEMINNWDCRKYVITFNLLQHWMTHLAPQKVPFETIVDYTRLKDACRSIESASAAFKEICQKEDTLEYKEYIVSKEMGLIVKGGLCDNGEKNCIEDKDGVNGGGYYAMVGDRVAINGNKSKLADLVLEQKNTEKKTMIVGDKWDIGGCWTLRVDGINARSTPRKVNFLLSYMGNNREVDVDEGKLYTYDENFGDELEVPLFLIYIDRIFSGSISDMVQFKYTWAISKPTS